MDLQTYNKKKDFLICLDSDGCVLDTMDAKHKLCMGPCLVEEWGLSAWETYVMELWSEINLYSMDRGINRFKGLAKALRKVNDTCCVIEGLEELEAWAMSSPELSNQSLERELAVRHSIGLKKTLSWSRKSNVRIQALSLEDEKAYPGVDEALAAAHEYADIAVISNAYLSAIEREWGMNDLLGHVDLLLTQEVGNKVFCIKELLKKGYAKDHVLMVGDAPGDQAAAAECGVLYYPILVRHERESWQEFREAALNRLLEGTYQGAYQEEKQRIFEENLH